MEEAAQVVADCRIVVADQSEPVGSGRLGGHQKRTCGCAEHAIRDGCLKDPEEKRRLRGVAADLVAQHLGVDEAVDRKAQPAGQDQPDHTESRPAQSEGVLGAGGLLVNGPEAGQQVDLVRQRHRHRDRRIGHRIRGSERRIMLLRRGGDGGAFPGPPGIITPHHALQLGKLVDHLAREIGLGEARRALGEVGVGADQRRDLARQGGDAGDALALGTEPVVEGHAVELRGHRLRRHAQVVLPEEGRIREPRRQHPRIARKDRRPVVGGLAVGHHHVAHDPPRPGVAHREELLMRLHGGLQHFRRQVEEAFLDASHQHHGPFHQPGDLGEEGFVLHHLQALREGELRRVVADPLGALRRVEQHPRPFESRRVILEARDANGLRRHEAVAAGGVAGADPLDLQRHGLAARLGGELAEDAVERAHPAQAALAPAHGFRPGEAAHRRLDRLRHDLGRRPARAFGDGEPDLRLLVVADLEVLPRQPGGAQKALDRLLGRVHPRTLALLAHRRRPLREPRDRQRQPPRRHEGRRMGVGQPALDQALGDQAPQILRRPRLHARRDFLG